MKQPWVLLALGLIGLAGCVTAPPTVQIAPTRTAAAVPPVRAEQVTAQNAQKLSQALADELDREAQHEINVPPPKR